MAVAATSAYGQTPSDDWASYDRDGDRLRLFQAQSLAAHQKALAIAEREAKADPANLDWQHALWLSEVKVGETFMGMARFVEALAAFEAGMAAANRIAAVEPDNVEWQLRISMSWVRTGEALERLGRLQECLDAYRKALSIGQRAADSLPGAVAPQKSLLYAYRRVGSVLTLMKALTGALESYRAAKEIAGRLVAAGSDDASMGDLADCDDNVGVAFVLLLRFEEGIKVLNESLKLRERLNKEKPHDSTRAIALAETHTMLGKALLRQGSLDRSLSEFRASLAIKQGLVAAEPANPLWQVQVAYSYGNIGDVQKEQGRRDDARASLQKGRDILARVSPTSDAIAWFDQQLRQLR